MVPSDADDESAGLVADSWPGQEPLEIDIVEGSLHLVMR